MSEWFHVGQKVRPVAGFEGYYSVTDEGQVYSHRSDIYLKGSPIPGGYLTVALSKPGVRQSTFSIHRLVAAAFCENPHNKPAVNHINGVTNDNRAVNLEWVTPRENTMHGVARGTIKGFPKRIPEDQRAEIRATYLAGGISLRNLAAQHGVTKSAVRYMLAELERA